MNTTKLPARSILHPLPARALLVLLTLAFLTAACLGGAGNQTLGHTAPLAGEATLTCSEACAEQAQCGQSDDRGTVVLLSPFAPATQGHGMAIPADTPVQILDRRDEPGVVMQTNELTSILFYLVALPDRLEPGWVAGWCLAGTPPAAEG